MLPRPGVVEHDGGGGKKKLEARMGITSLNGRFQTARVNIPASLWAPPQLIVAIGGNLPKLDTTSHSPAVGPKGRTIVGLTAPSSRTHLAN